MARRPGGNISDKKQLVSFSPKYSRRRLTENVAPQGPPPDQSIALKWNSPPSFRPEGQREVTVLVRL